MALEITRTEVAEVATTIHQWAAGLDALHARIAHRFRRPEVRQRARRYLAGLLGPVERSACWLRRSGTPTPCVTACGPMWSSTWATRAGCWSSMRRGS